MKAKIKASKQKANAQNDTIVEQLQDEEEAAATTGSSGNNAVAASK